MSDLNSLKRVARKNGWDVELRKGGHLVWISPDKSVPLIFSAATPGAYSANENLKAKLRKHGLPV